MEHCLHAAKNFTFLCYCILWEGVYGWAVYLYAHIMLIQIEKSLFFKLSLKVGKSRNIQNRIFWKFSYSLWISYFWWVWIFSRNIHSIEIRMSWILASISYAADFRNMFCSLDSNLNKKNVIFFNIYVRDLFPQSWNCESETEPIYFYIYKVRIILVIW